jgi:hypothetical protein
MEQTLAQQHVDIGHFGQVRLRQSGLKRLVGLEMLYFLWRYGTPFLSKIGDVREILTF